MIYKVATPDQVHGAFALSLSPQVQRGGWVTESQGLTIIFREAKGKPFRRVSVEGKGPLPLVRWEFAPPKKPKK